MNGWRNELAKTALNQNFFQFERRRRRCCSAHYAEFYI